MYQFESSSTTKFSIAFDAVSGSYASSAVRTTPIVWFNRERIQRSRTGRSERWTLVDGSSGLKPSSRAYVAKKEYEFQSGIMKRRRTSSATEKPKLTLTLGFTVEKSQRIVSTPMCSAASSNQIALPLLLCISSPFSSRISAYEKTFLNEMRPVSAVLIARTE